MDAIEPVTFAKEENSDEIAFANEKEGRTYTKKRSHFTMEHPKGKRTFAATYWIPNSEIKAAAYLSHGYGEYLGPGYDDFAQFLCDHGVMVFGHDHIGHGRSSGERVQADSMDDYVNPILSHVKALRQWPTMKNGEVSKPVFLVGHSMGGLISLFTVFKAESLFKGMVLMGPLLIVDPSMATPTKKWIAKVVQGIAPSFALGGIEKKYLSRDQNFVAQMDQDQLNWHGGFKARQSWVTLQACDYAQNNLPNINLPILVLQGGKDKLVVAKGAQMIFDNVSSTDKELKYYEDAFHNLYNELPDVKNDAITRSNDFIVRRI